jgi:hypothetical protein
MILKWIGPGPMPQVPGARIVDAASGIIDVDTIGGRLPKCLNPEEWEPYEQGGIA